MKGILSSSVVITRGILKGTICTIKEPSHKPLIFLGCKEKMIHVCLVPRIPRSTDATTLQCRRLQGLLSLYFLWAAIVFHQA